MILNERKTLKWRDCCNAIEIMTKNLWELFLNFALKGKSNHKRQDLP